MYESFKLTSGFLHVEQVWTLSNTKVFLKNENNVRANNTKLETIRRINFICLSMNSAMKLKHCRDRVKYEYIYIYN